jgi:aminopeptidase N
VRLHLAGALVLVFFVVPASSYPGFALEDECSYPYDVLHYNITMTIDVDSEILYGDASVRALSQAAGLDSITLDFTVLAVDAVMSGSDTLAYRYEDPALTIYLDRPHNAGDTLEVGVFYHGHPGNEGPDGSGGFFFDGFPKRAFQIGLDLQAEQPSMGRYWFPCRDWPCDKATAEYHITVPGINKTVVCNGDLVGIVADSVDNLITYDWEEPDPISTHLMTVNAGKYTDLVDSTYPWIHYWVYPNQVDDATVHFQNIATMMDAFVYRYGAYPFERFGYVVVPEKEMHHQTCATIEASMITPDTRNEWLLANLLGHQWWGGCVSVGDWRDLWLSRSFAMYSEAVFQEYAYGSEAYRDYVFNDNIKHVINDLGYSPLYDPLFPFARTIYEKGSCVLHMLRYVIGESTFFEALRTYRETYEYGTATTADFQYVVETVSGQDLDWFFSEWVYDIRWPVYEYAWQGRSDSGGHMLDLAINQVQDEGPIFTMPVEVLVETVSGDSLVTLWVDEAHEEFVIATGDEPTGVILDPCHWILMEAGEVPYAGISGGSGASRGLALKVFPSPSAGAFTIHYAVPHPQCARVEVYDVLGRRVSCLVDHVVGLGVHETTWPGTDHAGNRVAPGTYFCRLSVRGDEVTSRVILVK